MVSIYDSGAIVWMRQLIAFNGCASNVTTASQSERSNLWRTPLLLRLKLPERRRGEERGDTAPGEGEACHGSERSDWLGGADSRS